MGIFRQFPYSNFHEMNLDWLLRKMKELGQSFDDLTQEFKDFVVSITDKIQEDVNNWLEEHPEATTTVQDKSLTLSKFADSLRDTVILNDKTQIHKRVPEFINDTKYIPDTHNANGFTADDEYFYIAHHVRDAELLYITKVDRTDFTSETFETSLAGHGNALTIYKNYLYVTDTSGRVDVLDKRNLDIVIGNFTPDLPVNAYSLKEINGKLVSCGCTSGNNVITVNEINNNYSTLVERFIMDGISNAYVQGLDHTSNVVYVSYSYGQQQNDWYCDPFIDAYSWSGQLLNRVYISMLDYDFENEDQREIEIEDIYRDSLSNMLYYVTASGRIGKLRTVGFTTSQTAHGYNSGSFRISQYRSFVLANNDDPQVEYYEDTLLASKIKHPAGLTQYQGYGLGNGILCGNNAIVFLRGAALTMITAGTENSVISAVANYSFNAGDDTFVYGGGAVWQRANDGTVTRTGLKAWCEANPTIRTTINMFGAMPLTVPFTSANPFIPVDTE